jgi:hypothetical protein
MTATKSSPILCDFDNLVADDKSKTWLKENQLLPSQWELLEPEMAFIRKHSVALRVFNSPSFVYDFSLYPVVNNGVLFVVFFDADLVTRHGLSQKEAIAVILHEIGHVTNTCGKKLGDERDADDYARHCGFGKHLADGLETLRKSGVSYFDKPEIQDRINWIRNSPEPKLDETCKTQ